MTYKIIETHCHLDYLKERPLPEILAKAADLGIEKILTISVEPENFDTVFDLANTYEQIYFTQGIHPHDAKLRTDEAMLKIQNRASHKKMLAVGEIGLDYYYEHSPPEIQKAVFKEQLDLATKLEKPVVIHARDADDDMIAILTEKAPALKRKGVIHSFTSGPKLAKAALDLGFYLGFNGIITFKNAQNVRDIVKLCPLERLLLETDSPFLTPVPHRGKENTPEYLPFILEKIAEIKEITPTELEKILYQNSIDLFKF